MTMVASDGYQSIDHKNLYSYLTTLPSSMLENLYKHPNPCLCMAIFRDLVPMAQKFVLRQLFIDQVLPKSALLAWITPDGRKDHDDAVRLLIELRIWSEAPSSAGLMGWKLNEHFRKGIQAVVVGGGPSWGGDVTPTAEETTPVDVAFLEKYARDQWEHVLHYLAGLKTRQTASHVVDVLATAGLVRGGNERDGGITQNGFRFLLMDTPSQVWRFVLSYLQTTQKWNMDLIECISFIFQLSFSQTGKHYSSSGFSDNQMKMLQHFRDYGLVYMRSGKRPSSRFYPTNLVMNLSGGASSTNASFAEGYIVVETNYRIIAYTDSPLKIAVVSYFSEMLYRFPNLAIGILTRESIRNALAKGITADEIIRFLRMHAHPQMRESSPILPSTLTDQIKLWEMERARFEFTDGVLYNQINSVKDYELLRNYANDLGVNVLSNNDKRLLVVTTEGHVPVRAFWKRQKKE
ncbi:hypothetical protein RvY_17806 [Ramazzottius varieornatus]|uniref:General transcription factor IIH subunit 4 n=1 Tax=Ramazzottius varieornatus TaxID=947166 RepID=A0A1D1W3H3_RAMVA|nr:hypothetical protein RvY_17806 [Ramazzottius varieornatus]